MKKLLSLTLVLLLLLSLASCSLGSGSTTECTAHTDADANMYCDTCGAIYVCPGHADADENGYCDNCIAPYVCDAHADANKDGLCDICAAAYVCPGHKDSAGDGQCDVCLATFVCYHVDRNDNGACDICGANFNCASHKDVDPMDGYCDFCEAAYICQAHKDTDSNGVCDLCGAAYSCPGHRDADENEFCDECGASTTSGGAVNPKSVAAFVRAYANSLPTRITTSTERTVGLGSSSYVLSSESTLLTGSVAGKIATIYSESYQELRDVASGSGDTEEKVFKTVTLKKEFLQGKGTRDTVDGVRSSWNARGTDFAPTKGSIALNINESNITVNAFEINENSHVMRFTVDKTKVQEVFGMNGVLPNIDATGNVNVTLVSNGATISSIIISYNVSSTKDMPAQSVVIEAEYKYSIQNITID
ncbi:MAG: hypothetical protein IKV16_04115 [Clostridia bacterium]|nr:hypothetical protein [Clostridia bacterium]